MTRSRRWNIGTAVVVVLVLIAGWLLLVSPKRTEASELKVQASDAVAQNQFTEGRIRQLKVEQKDLPAQQAKLAEFARQVPPTPDLPSLIREVTKAANSYGVSVTVVALDEPAPLESVAGLSTIPIQIVAEGEYANLKLFLADLEDGTRALLVGTFQVALNQATTPEEAARSGALAMTLDATVFISAVVPESGGAGDALGRAAGPATAPTAAPTAAPTPSATAAATP